MASTDQDPKVDSENSDNDLSSTQPTPPVEEHYDGGDIAMIAMDVDFSAESTDPFVTREEFYASASSAYLQGFAAAASPVTQRPGARVNASRKETLKARSPARTTRSPSERVITEAMRHEFWYGLVGLLLGLAAIVGGVILGIRGVVGATSWSARLLGLESNINDAAPGVVLFIVGLFMIIATKPRYVLKRLRDGK